MGPAPRADEPTSRPTGSTVAREVVRESLERKGVPRPKLDLATLLLCELLTNAVRHGDGAFELSVERRGEEALVISVVDDGPWFDPRDALSSGAGLALIENLATDWGVRYVEAGLEVWFEL
jgi:anti-sigma regulatory factor (Ser/Thr protein kinase)